MKYFAEISEIPHKIKKFNNFFFLCLKKEQHIVKKPL